MSGAIRPYMSGIMIVVLAGGLVGPAQAVYSTAANVIAHADGAPGSDDHTSYPEAQVLSLADSASAVGDFGTYGYAEFYVDLASASIGTYASAAGGDEALLGESRAAGWFKDTLTFMIPAGTYPAGVYCTIPGHLEGTMIGNGYMVSLEYDFGIVEGSFYEDQFQGASSSNLSLNQDFTLTAELVAPGETLSGSLQVEREVRGFIRTHAGCRGSSESQVNDYFSTGSLLSVNVPGDVSWSSESGVFLPEPATLALVIVGSMVPALRRRPRRRG